jgi:hypothetical protein
VQQRADARLHLQPDDQRTGVRYATFLVSGRTTGAPHLWKDVLAQLSVVIAMLEVKRRVTPSAHNPPYALCLTKTGSPNYGCRRYKNLRKPIRECVERLDALQLNARSQT